MAAQQTFLAFDAQFIEPDVARLAQQLGVIHSGAYFSLVSAGRSVRVLLTMTVLPLRRLSACCN